VNKEASHYVRLFGGNKIGNLIFRLPLVECRDRYLVRKGINLELNGKIKSPIPSRFSLLSRFYYGEQTACDEVLGDAARVDEERTACKIPVKETEGWSARSTSRPGCFSHWKILPSI
jgi:hypothetical protein